MNPNLKRTVGWRTRMQENLHDGKDKPFAWGIHDCASFAAKHVKALTGEDFYTPYEGQYSTAFGALKSLKGNGYNNLHELCQGLFPEVHVSELIVGDLVTISADETGYAIGIVLGETIGVLTPNGYGIIRKSNPTIVAGFKIG